MGQWSTRPMLLKVPSKMRSGTFSKVEINGALSEGSFTGAVLGVSDCRREGRKEIEETQPRQL